MRHWTLRCARFTWELCQVHMGHLSPSTTWPIPEDFSHGRWPNLAVRFISNWNNWSCWDPLDLWDIHQKMAQTRWFKPWPFDPLVGGHLTIRKRSQRIARNVSFCCWCFILRIVSIMWYISKNRQETTPKRKTTTKTPRGKHRSRP